MNTALQKHQQPYKNITLCLFWPLNIPTRKHTLVFFRPMNQPVDLDISTVSIFNKTVINLVGSSEIVQSQFSVLSYQIYLRHQTKQEQKSIPNKIIRQLLPHYWRVISFLPRNASKSPPYGAEQTKSSLSRPPNRDPENKQISEIHLQHKSSSSPGGLSVKAMDVYFHSGRNHHPTKPDRMHTWIYTWLIIIPACLHETSSLDFSYHGISRSQDISQVTKLIHEHKSRYRLLEVVIKR